MTLSISIIQACLPDFVRSIAAHALPAHIVRISPQEIENTDAKFAHRNESIGRARPVRKEHRRQRSSEVDPPEAGIIDFLQ